MSEMTEIIVASKVSWYQRLAIDLGFAEEPETNFAHAFAVLRRSDTNTVVRGAKGDAFDAGKAAASAGQIEEDNPFRRTDPRKACDWLSGHRVEFQRLKRQDAAA